MSDSIASRPGIPRIESLHIKNFRALCNVEIKNITPLTVLLGPNGSGKSTVFDAFAFLAECFSDGLRRAWERRGRFKQLRSRGSDGRFLVVNRVAIEELEAWFFGDIGALRSAYPRLSPTIDRKAAYRDPDRIRGGTWEALHRELRNVGHCGKTFPKIEVARTIARHMDPNANRSRSFEVFHDGIEALLAQENG